MREVRNDAEQRQEWRVEWAKTSGDTDYDMWLENRLLDMQALKLKSLHVEDGKIDMVCQGDLVSIFAQCMAEMLDGQCAVNVVEYKVSHPVKGPLVLTLQRQFGKTPMDLVKEARSIARQLLNDFTAENDPNSRRWQYIRREPWLTEKMA